MHGHFELELGAHFKLELGGQYHWNLHSTTHIAIYAALLQFRMDKGFINPLQAYSIEIQKIAKIASPKTYHKCMRELDAYGYVIYVPTKNKNKRSKVYFHLDEKVI